jgi:PDZ domain-containing secreted protein
MENTVLRNYYKLEPEETGVLVLETAPLAPSSKVLKKGDVVLAIDGVRVANDGTIPFRKGSLKERVQLNYYITQKFADESVRLSILRGGKRKTVEVKLWIPQKLIPRVLLKQVTNSSSTSVVGGTPSYLMIGGLVMTALSREYLQVEFDTERMQNFDVWAEEFKLLALADATCKTEGEEVVLLSQVISHPCNIGYEMQRNTQLLKFNGVAVKNLKHLYDMIYKSKPDTLTTLDSNSREDITESARIPFVFEFSGGQVIVMDGPAALSAQEQVRD